MRAPTTQDMYRIIYLTTRQSLHKHELWYFLPPFPCFFLYTQECASSHVLIQQEKCQELLPTKESEYLGESPSDCKGQILSHESEYSKIS